MEVQCPKCGDPLKLALSRVACPLESCSYNRNHQCGGPVLKLVPSRCPRTDPAARLVKP